MRRSAFECTHLAQFIIWDSWRLLAEIFWPSMMSHSWRSLFCGIGNGARRTETPSRPSFVDPLPPNEAVITNQPRPDLPQQVTCCLTVWKYHDPRHQTSIWYYQGQGLTIPWWRSTSASNLRIIRVVTILHPRRKSRPHITAGIKKTLQIRRKGKRDFPVNVIWHLLVDAAQRIIIHGSSDLRAATIDRSFLASRLERK